MPHLPRSLQLVPLLLALGLATAGCQSVDNTGGPPPEGDSLTFTIPARPSAFCGGVDDAMLIADADDADAWLADCEATGTARDAIDAALASLDAGQQVVALSAALGGCARDFEVQGFYLDGDVLTAWILKEDTSYGRNNVACTADLGEGHAIAVVDASAAALTVEVHVSSWNPELPNGPVSTLEQSSSAQ